MHSHWRETRLDGLLAQVTYKIGDTRIGVNYGESNLDLAPGGPALAAVLVRTNRKYTVDIHHSIIENLTLLAQFTDTEAEAHNGIKNDSTNFSIGACPSL